MHGREQETLSPGSPTYVDDLDLTNKQRRQKGSKYYSYARCFVARSSHLSELSLVAPLRRWGDFQTDPESRKILHEIQKEADQRLAMKRVRVS